MPTSSSANVHGHATGAASSSRASSSERRPSPAAPPRERFPHPPRVQIMSGFSPNSANKRPLEDLDSDEEADDDDAAPGRTTLPNSKKRNATSNGRKKVDIAFITDKAKRNVSFTKRKAGIMKKAYELSTLTGAEVLVLVKSETGTVYAYGTKGLSPIVNTEQGKRVIQMSLNGELNGDGEKAMELDQAIEGEVEEEGGKFTRTAYETAPTASGSGTKDILVDSHRLRSHSSSNNLPNPLPSDFSPSSTFQYTYSPTPATTSSTFALPTSSLPLPPPRFPAHPSSPSMHPLSPQMNPIPSIPDHQQQQQQSYQLSMAQRNVFERAQDDHRLYQNFGAALGGIGIGVDMASGRGSPSGQMDMHAEKRYSPSFRDSGGTNGNVNGREAGGGATMEDLVNLSNLVDASTSLGVETDQDGMGGYVGGLGLPGGGARGRGTGASSSPQGLPSRNFGLRLGLGLPRGQGAQVEERKLMLQEEARRALEEAKTKMTIPSFLKAYFLLLRSQTTVTVPIPNGMSSLTSPTEYTLQLFGKICEQNSFDNPHQLELAVSEFVHTFLPSQNVTLKQVIESKQHLFLFFDFLESNQLISPQSHYNLTLFQRIELDQGERRRIVEIRFEEWSRTGRGKYKERFEALGKDGIVAVEGWFEIYRVRGNFVLLKEKELSGDQEINARLSPFKVRVPRSLTPYLKIDDSLRLSLRVLSPSPSCPTPSDIKSWFPYTFSGFEPTASLEEEDESETDLAVYRNEIARLALEQGEDAEEVREGKVVLEQLERAEKALREGEMSDEL